MRSGMEFKLGDGNSGLRIHGALPKGTNRKYVGKRIRFHLCCWHGQHVCEVSRQTVDLSVCLGSRSS